METGAADISTDGTGQVEDEEKNQTSVGQIIAFGVIAGIVAGVATFLAMRSFGMGINPATVAGVAGAIAGGMIPSLVSRI